MSIISLSRDWGVTPSVVRMLTTNTLAEVAAAGYLTSQYDIILTLNKGEFEWVASDLVAVSAIDGREIFQFTDGDLSTLVSQSGGLTAVSVSGTSQALAAGSAYIFNNAGATTGNLPASPTIGDLIKIKGNSAAPWIIQANTGQVISYGSVSSTAAGTATSTSGTDSLQLMYIAANLWSVDWALSSGIVLA